MGASSSRSVPGSMSSRPFGFASSEAILASILEPASPTDPVSPVTALMAVRSCSPISSAEAVSSAVPPASRSTKASSRLRGSTSGESRASSSITWSLTVR